MKPAAEFIRVSTGSQDESSQVKFNDEYAEAHGFTVVKRFVLHGYSASHGMQEPALREAIADMERGDYSTLIVTDSSRLDRREDLDAQAEILLAIRAAGGDVISISEPEFGKTDFAGRIVTLVIQQKNAEKSKDVKKSVYRGMSMIRDNGAHHGPLPMSWASAGERYAKQACCTDPDAVKDIYERVARREPVLAVGRRYGVYAEAVRRLIRFEANHTGIKECSYTYMGVRETWAHKVTPVVSSELWWRANKVLAANSESRRANKGGRPVARPANWISGVLDCPGCGNRMFINSGVTPAGRPRTSALRCSGNMKERRACGLFKGCDAEPVAALIDDMFAYDDTPVLAFQRVAGNAHELDALNAELRKVKSRFSATDDDDELDALVAERKAVRARIEGFTVVPDSYDYAPTGQTVAGMWNDGDDIVKRGMARAVKNCWGMALASHEGQWILAIGTAASKDSGDTGGIVDLGNGLCFRR